MGPRVRRDATDTCVRYHSSYWYHNSFEWTINRRTILKLVNFVTTSPRLPYMSVCLSVVVRKLQVAILARSSREMYQTVRIDCHSFLSWVRISVRLRKCLYEKNTQKLSRKPSSPASVQMNEPAVTVDRQRPVDDSLYLHCLKQLLQE